MDNWPVIGDMLYDEYGHIGMTTDVDYCEDAVVNIIIEWYIDGESYREPYRVGRIKHSDDLMFMLLSYYNEMRQRYSELRAQRCK